MGYGLLGEKLSGTVIQKLFNKIDKYGYEMWEKKPEELDSFIKDAVFLGVYVEEGCRDMVYPYVEEFSREAKEVRAVNTVIFRDGHLTGYHTEYKALESVLRRMELKLEGKNVLILGDGETGRIARLLASDKGASRIYQIPQDMDGKCEIIDFAYQMYGDADVLIQTGSCGRIPDLEECPVDLDRLPNLVGVVDTVWDPLRTALILEAEKRGIPAEGGLYFLTAQAIHTAQLFKNISFEEKKQAGKYIDSQADEEAEKQKAILDDRLEKLYREVLNEVRNLVLIGMSQVGKTTVGTMLSDKMKRKLMDTDQLIIAREGCQIVDIFAKGGEPYFRDVESGVIRDLVTEHGLIIATGGGAVLREENMDALKKNGLVIFLDRPLDQITPTSDRPLADTADKVQELFRERYPIYKSICDRQIINHLSADVVTDKILRVLEGRKKLLVINGPGLNMLGIRDPDVYGYTSYNRLCHEIKVHALELGAEVECFQSNHEGDLVDKIHEAYGVMDGIIIDPGAYAYTSLALLDALKMASVPTVEVHLREEAKDEFRQKSYIRGACITAITGHGTDGYLEAMDLLMKVYLPMKGDRG
ncbi:MAG: type II 3-dehydroquinate dehydratase [Eubacterium sp.]|nr:type II 3-dehydroquinate dehydratase [Eubacterium sp.]